MADPLSVLGGLAAGMQLVLTAAKAVLATIKLMKDMKGIPQRISSLLNDVADSISRLGDSCNAGSKLLQKLETSQVNRLSRCASALYPALKDIHSMLTPLISSNQSKGKSVRRLWKTLLSLKVERELSEKLGKLNRLNLEVVRELGFIGLEFHLGTNALVMSSTATSTERFSNIEAKMDSLRDEFEKFTSSIHQAHAVTLEPPDKLNSDSIEWSPSPNNELVESRQCSDTISSPIPYFEEGRKTLKEREEQIRRYLSKTPSSNNISTSQHFNANLEFVLFNIRTFYTEGNFDPPPAIQRAAFWKDTESAIYFMKVTKGAVRGSSQSQTRGLRLLKNSTADASSDLNQGTAILLIELLSTLSPINTTTCPYVRESMLQYLSELARKQLPRDHPIALVINKLKDDNGDKDLTLRAFTFIVERLRATLGPIHELTRFATKSLCALLRRSGDYVEALRVTNDGLRAIRALLGPGSLQERLLSRQVEHVYMDQCDWPAALGVCFDIVGQKHLGAPNPDPRYHDTCAVHTMEDIAKICESVGNLEQAVAWLKQARISGGMAWGRTEELAHIQDKLNELLKQMGREDELQLWSTSFGPEIDSQQVE
ncbi:uncharacterized protein K452DRAFT_317361 [Aplosporella prunicola CBS 121167]|uniref:Fungal N-terminal domain-containing protein n=1 Tax=Aplosporella prunicola CBS 121167 TaxID=1176127 RepID=A0A6A6BGL8_9PEZI|nr:uncharacterized protein K452DRAFT_317361 [Aplosporella prunicola CBS 121167]KAF2143126.1 hypothetical protein K452DRAFT_317361 [Aplosporella prunicola CBS 121167]